MSMPVLTSPRAPRTAPSTLIIVLAMEFLAVGLFALMAGISDEIGTVVVMLIVGFWLVYLVTNANVIAGLGNAINILSGNPSNS